MRPTEQVNSARWHAADPSAAYTWLSAADCPWWIAGGWALDLFIGRQTRSHGDLDVGVARRDARQLFQVLPDWEFYEAKKSVLSYLESDTPRDDVNSLWARPRSEQPWSLEILLDATDGDDWVFRRYPDIRRPLASIVRRTADGIPYLAPEIQLLYKAKATRNRDELDFRRTLPRLTSAARAWFLTSLSAVDSTHPWLVQLQGLGIETK